jgi:hypothetical protein
VGENSDDSTMWLDLQPWLPLLTISLTITLCFLAGIALGLRYRVLSGKPQPTLSNIHEGELVHRVGHRACRLDVPVCPRSELIAGHLTPGFIVTR